MKLRCWAAILLFLSSYAPLGLILLIKDLDIATWKLKTPFFSIGFFLLFLLSLLVLSLTMRSIRGGDPVQIRRVSNQSGELVNYTIPYMISFFDFDLGNWASLSCFAIFMILLCVLTIRTQNIFINPILALAGYHLYDVEFQEATHERQGTFLCKGELSKDQMPTVRKLSSFLYFVVDKKTQEKR